MISYYRINHKKVIVVKIVSNSMTELCKVIEYFIYEPEIMIAMRPCFYGINITFRGFNS